MSSVSVIIPNYNRETLVGETIANMLDQSLPPHEVIVVDDGSTDRSVEVVDSFGARVKLVQQPNRGPGAARNAGLECATGEFVQFMDSDDLASRNKLAVQAGALAREGADLAYGPWAKFRLTAAGFEFADHILQPRPLPASRTMLEWFLSGWSIVLQTCLFRRTALARAGHFRTDLRVWEDGEFLVRLLMQENRVTFTPGCLTFYRLHDQPKLTGTGTTQQGRLRDRAAACRGIVELLGQHGVRLNRVARRDFAFGAWQIWREMRAAGGFDAAELEALRKLWGSTPGWRWQLRALIGRGGQRARWQFTGVRWSRPYRSCRPGAEALALARELGLVSGARADAGDAAAR